MFSGFVCALYECPLYWSLARCSTASACVPVSLQESPGNI